MEICFKDWKNNTRKIQSFYRSWKFVLPILNTFIILSSKEVLQTLLFQSIKRRASKDNVLLKERALLSIMLHLKKERWEFVLYFPFIWLEFETWWHEVNVSLSQLWRKDTAEK